MKKNYLVIAAILMILTGEVNAQSPDWTWAAALGDTLADRGVSVCSDASGNVYVTGYFEGTVDFDPGTGVFSLSSAGNMDIFIVKLNEAGNFVWARSFGSHAEDFGFAITVDSQSDIYCTGSFSGTVDFDPGAGTVNLNSSGGTDIFVLKIDSDANFILAKQMGGPGSDRGSKLAIDPVNHNIFTAGIFYGTADVDPGPGVFNLTSAGAYDIFISKFDSAGNFNWGKAIGGNGNLFAEEESIGALKLDPSGANIYLAGSFSATVDFDPAAGTTNITSFGSDQLCDIFFSKFDSAGNFRWVKYMGQSGYDWISDMAIAPNGDICVTGTFEFAFDFNPGPAAFILSSVSFYDAFVARYDSSGNFSWAKGIGGNWYDYGTSISIDENSGDMYATGFYESSVDFDPGPGFYGLTAAGYHDAFILALNHTGQFAWVKSIGGSGADEIWSVAANASGNIHLTGSFESSSVDFGSTVLTNARSGRADIFIAGIDTSNITGTNEPENFDNGVNVFYNPNTSAFSLISSDALHSASFRLFNSMGQMVLKRMNLHGETMYIPAENLDCGMYVYDVIENGKAICKGKTVVY